MGNSCGSVKFCLSSYSGRYSGPNATTTYTASQTCSVFTSASLWTSEYYCGYASIQASTPSGNGNVIALHTHVSHHYNYNTSNCPTEQHA